MNWHCIREPILADHDCMRLHFGNDDIQNDPSLRGWSLLRLAGAIPSIVFWIPASCSLSISTYSLPENFRPTGTFLLWWYSYFDSHHHMFVLALAGNVVIFCWRLSRSHHEFVFTQLSVITTLGLNTVAGPSRRCDSIIVKRVSFVHLCTILSYTYPNSLTAVRLYSTRSDCR